MTARQLALGFVPVLLIAAVPHRTNAVPPRDNPARPESRQEVSLVPGSFGLEILVDGRPVRQYSAARGGDAHYIEALKGKAYAIRLHNPLGIRVAVALSVDGLNTIDARHTTAHDARKWVLDPYETVTISGWQTSMRQAHQFFFTTEEESYARELGASRDLGLISAVFFRERAARILPLGVGPRASEREAGKPEAPSPQAADKLKERRLESDEYAATGFGEGFEHAVRRVHLELEDAPAAACDIRYEFRAQLARLGILPGREPDALRRRERARGFEEGFCPEPKRRH
jgi:hypothetical protein